MEKVPRTLRSYKTHNQISPFIEYVILQYNINRKFVVFKKIQIFMVIEVLDL